MAIKLKSGVVEIILRGAKGEAGEGVVDQVARDAASAAQSTANTNTSSISALDTRLTAEEGKEVIDTTARSSASSAQSTANTANNKTDTNASDITALTTRVTSAENNISSNDTDILDLQGRVNVLEGGGGTNPGNGGTGWPSETIVISSKDLTDQGYKSLKGDLTLKKTEAPKLAQLYSSNYNRDIIELNTTNPYKTYYKSHFKIGDFYITGDTGNVTDARFSDASFVTSYVVDGTGSGDPYQNIRFDYFIGEFEDGILTLDRDDKYSLQYIKYNVNSETPQDIAQSAVSQWSIDLLTNEGEPLSNLFTSIFEPQYGSFINRNYLVISGEGNTSHEFMLINLEDLKFFDINTPDYSIFKSCFIGDYSGDPSIDPHRFDLENKCIIEGDFGFNIEYSNSGSNFLPRHKDRYIGLSKTGKVIIVTLNSASYLDNYGIWHIDVEGKRVKFVEDNTIGEKNCAFSYRSDGQSYFIINNTSGGFKVYDTDTMEIVKESDTGSIYYYMVIGSDEIMLGNKDAYQSSGASIQHYSINGKWINFTNVTSKGLAIGFEYVGNDYQNRSAGYNQQTQTQDEIFLMRSDGTVEYVRLNLVSMPRDDFTILKEESNSDKEVWILIE